MKKILHLAHLIWLLPAVAFVFILTTFSRRFAKMKQEVFLELAMDSILDKNSGTYTPTEIIRYEAEK